MKNCNEIVIFLGPSLPIEKAQNILPNACYFPPVRCGDIIRVMRLQPNIIGIIDGCFEYIASVWHKEILLAIEKGIKVFGAASLGALRAAELYKFGMIGIGKIFEDYQSSKIINDDEVAVIHSPKFPYKVLTDAAVNIRATLEYAYNEKVIDEKNRDIILNKSLKMFYKKRNLKLAAMQAINIHNQEQINKFIQWLNAGNYKDQKKQDSELLLMTIANYKKIDCNISFKLNQTSFLHTLRNDINCRPLQLNIDKLNIHEQTAFYARYLEHVYVLARRLAYLLSVLNEIDSKINFSDIKNDDLGLHQINTTEWKIMNDADENYFELFYSRLEKLQNRINYERFCDDEFNNKTDEYIIDLLRLFNHYTFYKKSNWKDIDIISVCREENLFLFTIYYKISMLWQFLDKEINSSNIFISPKYIREYSNKFRLRNNLLTVESFSRWLINNDINELNYFKLMEKSVRFNYFVLERNIGFLGHNINNNNWWLLDALWLTGVYSEAKDLMNDKSKLNSIKNKLIFDTSIDQDYLLALDFPSFTEE